MARQKPNAFIRTVPIIDWLPHYERSWLPLDLLAGLSVWALVVPQALAYAAVVGVPAQYGLYTILGASVLYAVFAATRLPLAAVVIALLLTTSAGIAVTPLIIVAAVISYLLVAVLETTFAPPAPKVRAASDGS